MEPRRIEITIPGQPRGKGRPRFRRLGNFVGTYTDAKTKAYEDLIAQEALVAMEGQSPLEGPLSAYVRAVFTVPKSWPKKKKESAEHHTVKPDLDNVVKGALDATESIVYSGGDQVICKLIASKTYGPEPMLQIMLTEIEG